MKNNIKFDGSVQYELEKFGDRLTVNCPDEDSEIYIKIRDGKSYAGITLTLSEAEQFSKYILGHIKNAKLNEPSELELFCEFLESKGYIDSDWRDESPSPIKIWLDKKS